VKLFTLPFGIGDKNMNKIDMEYIKSQSNTRRVIRTEILFTPFLVILPIFIGLLFIYNWYNQGYIEGNPEYFGTLILGILIIIGNALFDIPFIRSLKKLTKNKNWK
jgi:hypothetical protein